MQELFLTLKLAGKKKKEKSHLGQTTLKCGEAIYNIKDSMQQVQERTALAAPSLHPTGCGTTLWSMFKSPKPRTQSTEVTQRPPPNKSQQWYATDDQDFDVLQDRLLIYFYCQE